MLIEFFNSGWQVIPSSSNGPLVKIPRSIDADLIQEWDDRFHEPAISAVAGRGRIAFIAITAYGDALREAMVGIAKKLLKEPRLLYIKDGYQHFIPVNMGAGLKLKTLSGADYIDGEGRVNSVKLLCEGELVRIQGINPATGESASFNKKTIFKTTTLPLVSENIINNLINGFSEACDKNPVMSKHGENDKAHMSFDPESFLAQRIVNNDRDWQHAVKVLHQADSSEKTLAMAIKWCGTHGVSRGEVLTLWGDLKAGVALYARLAGKAGSNPDLDYYLENYFLISAGKAGKVGFVGNETKSPYSMRLSQWRQAHIKPVNALASNGSIKQMPISTAWLNHRNRKTLLREIYYPSLDRVVTLDGHECWNKCIMPNHKIIDPDPSHVELFLDHIGYLCDDDTFLLDWMADIIQRPHIRPTVTPLHISTDMRTGRGWIVSLLKKLIGDSNTSDLKLSSLRRKSAGPVELTSRILISVHEVVDEKAGEAHSDGMMAIRENIRSALSEPYVTCQQGVNAETLPVYARIFLMANRLNSINIPPGDGRIHVTICSKPKKPDAYYTRIYEALKEKGFVQSIYNYLLSHKYEQSTMLYDKMNEAKNTVIKNSNHPAAYALHVFKEIAGNDALFTYQDIFLFVDEYIKKYFGKAYRDNEFAFKQALSEIASSVIADNNHSEDALYSFAFGQLPDKTLDYTQLRVELFNKLETETGVRLH